MNTPLPGVSVSNLAGWLLTAGADEESDESLAARAAARWAERGGGAVRAAYEYWALTSTPSITKVLVQDQHPRGQGTANVIVWGEGGVGSAAVLLADAYIQARRPTTADVLVRAATEHVVSVSVTLTGTMSDRPAAMAQVLAGLQRLQIATPIGGTLYRSALIEAAMLPPGMVNAVLTVPAGDVVLASDEALTISPNVVWSGG